MPLAEKFPIIDDRRYDDIITEVRTRIARYTPEWTPVWTDLNDNDPGITLVQVFAWLTEMQLYRLGKVPELNYLKFLELLGIELNPAEAAISEITFPVKPAHTTPTVIVPKGAQVTAEAPDGGAPIVFETERALIALRAQLTSLQAFDGYGHQLVSAENAAATPGFLPFGTLARPDSALLLGFSESAEFPESELNLTVWVNEAGSRREGVACGLSESAVYPSARLRWEYWDGSAWRPLNLLKDETSALTRSGHVYLKTPPIAQSARTVMGAEPVAQYWLRALLIQSQYEQPPRLQAIRTNTTAARQAETVRDEVLGGSGGRRDQIFTLANTPVLLDSLRIEVDEGDGYQPWILVDDFFGSGSSDRHFTLNRTSGGIRFGDGVNGHIPVSNVNNPGANVVARTYRFGGGKRSNVAARTIKTFATPVDGVDDNKIYNLFAAHSGRDEERLDEAKRRAPRLIKSRCRAVTAEDFELLAMQAANIKRAKALPLFHPAFSGVKVPGVVTVIVVPDADPSNQQPLPSEGTLRTVCAYLDQRRLLTTEVYVIPPTYQKVEIEVDVIVNNDADLGDVKQNIETALGDYLHPLKGGEDNQGWPFGGTIFYSRLYQRIFSVAGVQSIQRLLIRLDGEEAAECRDVLIKPVALLYAPPPLVMVAYSFEE